MAYGVQFRNGNRVITIDNKTDMLVVKNNYTSIQPLPNNGWCMLPYYEDEITGFQVKNKAQRIMINAGNIAGLGAMGMPRQIFIADANFNYMAVRTRSLAKSSKMGASNATYGMRIWDTSVTPRKLFFDLGHPLFQPKNFHRLNWNQTCTILDNEWVFPLLWYSAIYPSSVELVKQSGNVFRVSSLLSPTGDGIPRNTPIALFWIMRNIT